jgi:hypothetical protein
MVGRAKARRRTQFRPFDLPGARPVSPAEWASLASDRQRRPGGPARGSKPGEANQLEAYIARLYREAEARDPADLPGEDPAAEA